MWLISTCHLHLTRGLLGLNGFGGDGNSEVKLARSGVIPGWVTFGEVSRQLPKVKPLGVIPETDNIVTAWGWSVTIGIRACPRPEVCRRGRRTLRGVD